MHEVITLSSGTSFHKTQPEDRKGSFFFLLKIALETSVESEALKQFEVRAKKAIETLVSIKAL